MRITLNGTDKNPWHKMNLKQNPFPQIARAEYNDAERQINSLDGDPLKGPEDIRKRLKGFSEELIELCIKHYQPGKRVRFSITFPERYP